MSNPKKVRKRDGRIVPFDQSRITYAIFRAMKEVREGDIHFDPQRVSDHVVQMLTTKYPKDYIPHVEEIQDVVGKSLRVLGFFKTAEAYTRYRKERFLIREKTEIFTRRFRKRVQESKRYFRNLLAEFIYYRTYSRWIDEEGRRETWIETVERYMNFMKENIGIRLTEDEYSEIQAAILNHDVMPSMRLLWSAGNAARSNNLAVYNCSFIAPTRLKDFSEIMYLLMCGAGVGFSVEKQFVDQFPIIKPQTGQKIPTYRIEDSKEGWGDSLTKGLVTWFEGKDIDFDFSHVRPQGARLKTMGGRSSGPEPLRALLKFARTLILSSQRKKLKSIDIHDLICKIGEITVMGGTRRSALISLSNLDDEEMRNAKVGAFYRDHPHRMLANNSAVYNDKPTMDAFLKEWEALRSSGAGERGIFNRWGLQFQIPKRRWETFQKEWLSSGTNPCGEIILRNRGLCNLTEIVARPEDKEETLMRKIRIATILGTYQSMFTNFPYVSFQWKKNCEEERLLGVSITGQWDCPSVRHPEILRKLRDYAVQVNREYAKHFDITSSLAVTCVKPSGTVSSLVDSASGIHPRHSPYYIRRVRIAAHDPLFKTLKEQGFPFEVEVGQSKESATTYVLEFPVKAPEGALIRNDLSAIEHLEYWKIVKQNFTEHNPSVTISIGDEEWDQVAQWVYANWEIVGGMSFLPRIKHVYELAPYEEITKEKYEELTFELPEIDFSKLISFELSDETSGSKELACQGNLCEHDPEEGSIPHHHLEK